MLFGLLPFGLEQIYTSSLRESGETMLPMIAGILAVGINFVLNLVLIFGLLGFPKLGVIGAAVATVISRVVQALVVVIWTHRHAAKMYFIESAYKSLRIPMELVGQLLGAGKMEEAVDTDTKLIAFTVMSCFGMGGLLFLCAPLFPTVYNTTSEVKALATNFIRVSAVCMPLYGFAHATYFTLRSGGKTVITFLFDSFFVWVGCIPVAYVLSRYSPLTPVLLYFVCQSMDWIKCVIGFILVKKRVWVKRLVV